MVFLSLENILFGSTTSIMKFPSGIGYDKQNDRVQTTRVNSIFSAIPLLAKDLEKTKNGESIHFDQFSARVTPRGDSSNFLEDLKLLFKP